MVKEARKKEDIKKETKKTAKKVVEKKINKDNINKFLSLAGEKIVEFGLNALERGVKEYAVEKVNDTSVEIKRVIDQKFKEYKKNFIYFGSLALAVVFLIYGLLETVLVNFQLEKFTNLIFGFIFLLVALFFRNK